jgi:hypothetical protein
MQQFLKYQNTLYCAGSKIYKRTNPNNWTQFTSFASTDILGFAATNNYLFISLANSPIKYAPISGTTNFANITSGSAGFANSVTAYDTLVFYKSNNGVFKLNTTLLGSATPTDIVQIADNLPYYLSTGNSKQYSYIGGIAGFGLAVFNGKLWLGTNGMSTFYKSLNDFGYSFTVGENTPSLREGRGGLYPNPTKDKITITNFTKGCQLTIYNNSGQLVLNTINSDSQTVDINKLEVGLYSYTVSDSKQNIVSSGKFVKE